MAVTYFVRMVAKEGQADNVLDLLLVNPRRIEAGEKGNIVFGVHIFSSRIFKQSSGTD